ncbi:MAG TPA: ABC transporter permease [Ktedonobacteraceae bacterium]|nr:ABC transporter permease [Ktedonobacteraceae bacterium]
MGVFWRQVWSNTAKDLRLWLRQWYNIVAALVMPLTYVLVVWLGSAAVGASPVALVVDDPGPVAQQMAQALVTSDVFRLSIVNASTASQMYHNLEVVAVVTIPAQFDLEVESGLRAPIVVQANNLNLDLTNDLRRAIPDAISVYYQQQTPDPMGVVVAEQDLRSQDVSIEQFSILPMISLLLLAHAVISSGIGIAREWEDQSIKELLLSPASPVAILLGKVIAGFVATFGLGLVLFSLGYGLGWTRPEGIFLVTALTTIALMALFATGLGIAVGAALRRVQSVTSLATTLSVWLFFLAGGISVLQFEPDWLKQIAAFDPLTYGTHALQMATFYASADLFARDASVLGAATLLVFLAAWLAFRRRFAR